MAQYPIAGPVTRLATAFAAAACIVLGAPPQALAAKDELVIGVSQFPTSFHPNIASHVVLSFIHGMTRRPFTVYDPDWKLVCMLCTELPDLEKGTAREWTTADGKPGLETDYTILPGATWGNGTPVTTKDVLHTWKIGRSEVSGVVGAELYRRMEEIVAKDDKSFTIRWNKRTCDYKGINDFNIVPAHLEADAAADPAQYRTRNPYDTDPTNPGLYFGPYRITRVEPGAFVVLEPNPTWWGEKPYFKRITVRTIENTAALEANLLSGEIDYIPGEDGISLDQALTFEKRHGSKYNVVFKPGLIYEHIDVNHDNPILADLRVRRALLSAIDRRAISQRLFEGKQPVANTSVNPLDAVYHDDVMKYPHDPDAARKLLDEAGWTTLKGGIRHNADGKPLQVEIMTTSGNRVRELIEQVVQGNLRDVGVDLRIRNEPPRVLFGRTLRERRYTDMVMYAWSSAPENLPRTTLHSTEIPTEANGYAGQNYVGYRNPAMDKVIDRAEVECAPAVQTALWREIQTIYAEDLPALPLYFRANPFVMPPWLAGVTPTGHQYPSTLWVERWKAQ
jgi:peptide/nickel transport system substrate-binding protein